jgi:hypothetical protein
MIWWIKKGAEIDPALLTPENVKALEEALWGTYVDSEEIRGVGVYQFYRVTSATQSPLFQRAECLHVRVYNDKVEYKFCRPYRLGTSYW